MTGTPTRRRAEALLRRGLEPVAAASVVASLLPLAAQFSWLADLFTHFRLQFLVIQLPLLAALLGLARFRWGLAVAVCLLLNGAALAPALLEPARAAGSTRSITLMSANIWAGNRDTESLLQRIADADPDIVVLLEHTRRLEPALEALRRVYPYMEFAPSPGFFGLALLSKFPVASIQVEPNGPTDYLHAEIATRSGAVELVGLHVLPPVSPDTWRTRNTQLAALASRLSDHQGPLLVCGDFNLSPYSPFFGSFAQASGLAPARTTRPLAMTWPTFMPVFGIPIDHCFVSDRITVHDVRVLGKTGSDHYPIWIEFTPDEAQ